MKNKKKKSEFLKLLKLSKKETKAIKGGSGNIVIEDMYL